MTAVLTQESNQTGLRLARELSPSVVDGTAVWNQQEPNSYKNFGGTYTLKARNPINDGRQNKKGVIVDLDSAGGWQEDITYNGVQNKIEGLMYANFRHKTEIATTAAIASGSHYTVASSTGLFANDLVYVSGFSNPANNGAKHVTGVTGTQVTVSETIADETATGKIVRVGFRGATSDLAYTASSKTLASTSLDFTTLGLIVGEWLYCDDDANPLGAGLGFARIKSIGTHAIVFDKVVPTVAGGTIIDAAGTGLTPHIFLGRVIKNEVGTAIQRITYQAERTLGKDDDGASDVQSEYLTGCVMNEGMFTFNSTDKATCEWTLLGAKYESRTSATGRKAGTRPVLLSGGAFNTSTDVKRLSLELVGTDTPLYGYLMNLSLTVKNNAKTNKAVGVLGSIGTTAGQFEVSAAATAYFANVTAAQAISTNANVTLDCVLCKDNQGMIFDVPLISLGDGRPDVKQNEVIQLPLSIDAATASSLNTATDFTLLIMFFDYLPNVAMA